MKNRNKFAKITVFAAAGALVLSALPVSAEDADVREIKVAVAGGFYTITYADDNGEAGGVLHRTG